MKPQPNNHTPISYSLSLIGAITLLALSSLSSAQSGQVLAQPPADTGAQSQSASSVTAKPVTGLTQFNERIKEYVKLRERLADKADKPSDESKPREIEAYQIALAEQVKVARAKAQAGDIFIPEIAGHIRHVIKNESKAGRLKELRVTAQELGAKSGLLRVNALYPESKELLEMPPELLLKLPELPKQLRYRLLGRHMLLMDGESRLIVDYLLNIWP